MYELKPSEGVAWPDMSGEGVRGAGHRGEVGVVCVGGARVRHRVRSETQVTKSVISGVDGTKLDARTTGCI